MRFFTEREEIKNGEWYWSYLKVKIFQALTETDGVLIGEYNRNYSSFYKTFYPFKKNGKYYALYSKDYQTTSLMELPSCKHICSDDSKFCPTEFYVPTYKEMNIRNDDESPDFGFVSGCFWGDDSSYKIRYIDLSKIEEGKISHSEKFGYIEQMPDLDLKQSIDFHHYFNEEGENAVRIACMNSFDIENDYITGCPLDVSNKSKEEIEKLPLYNGVDLNSLSKDDLIRLILEQDKRLNVQMGMLFDLHNLKVKIRQKYGEDAVTSLLASV